MANRGLIQCALGKLFAARKAKGKLDDAAAQVGLSTPNAKATYAQGTAQVEAGMWAGVKDKAGS